MKLMNELSLTLENPHWAVNMEFAVFDTILTPQRLYRAWVEEKMMPVRG